MKDTQLVWKQRVALGRMANVSAIKSEPMSTKSDFCLTWYSLFFFFRKLNVLKRLERLRFLPLLAIKIALDDNISFV